jgi:hypothetical protein
MEAAGVPENMEIQRQVEEICKKCNGTGLICGHVPVVGPDNCCVDYANAICPECNGRGAVKVNSTSGG